ncbi:MAG: hypothetical protein K2W92_01630 [Alphaproteobacteria bacterium]|nr:hypothetical protein [Alphaproteobacteria bacterium]
MNNSSEEKEEIKQETPPNKGNFALPTSQQPGPLIGFGQRVIDENQKQFYLFMDYVRGHKQHMADSIPSLVYGITDNFSAYLNVPIAVSYKQDKNHSSGWEDLFLQLEYAFYTNKTSHFTDQATIVTTFAFPTGSTKKQPLTGLGSPSFFLGTTFNRTYTKWFGFTSYGVVMTTSDERTKFGNEFLYQCGFGKNILTIDHDWIVALMVEVDGQYIEKNKIKSIIDPNSGGNTVYITPSLWISSKQLIVQLGMGFPVVQHLFGQQHKNNYLLAANFGWTF